MKRPLKVENQRMKQSTIRLIFVSHEVYSKEHARGMTVPMAWVRDMTKGPTHERAMLRDIDSE